MFSRLSSTLVGCIGLIQIGGSGHCLFAIGLWLPKLGQVHPDLVAELFKLTVVVCN